MGADVGRRHLVDASKLRPSERSARAKLKQQTPTPATKSRHQNRPLRSDEEENVLFANRMAKKAKNIRVEKEEELERLLAAKDAMKEADKNMRITKEAVKTTC